MDMLSTTSRDRVVWEICVVVRSLYIHPEMVSIDGVYDRVRVGKSAFRGLGQHMCPRVHSIPDESQCDRSDGEMVGRAVLLYKLPYKAALSGLCDRCDMCS